MKKYCIALAAACLFAAVFIARTQARPAAILTYQARFDGSDIVVIANPIQKTNDTNEKSLMLNIPSTGVETAFAVSLILKGDKALKTFNLHHYRADSQKTVMVNGPNFISFRMPGDFRPSEPQTLYSYLFFLVRESDGRYAPAGGQIDAADSVQVIQFQPNL